MIRYELKDKECQAAFEKAQPGFGRALQAACKKEFDDEFSYVCVRLNRGGGIFCDDEVSIRKTAIRTKGAYNPRAWNKFPEVTPPEGVWMRCEGYDPDTGKLLRAALVFDGENWKDTRGDTYWLGTVERFRPWDDGEEEK